MRDVQLLKGDVGTVYQSTSSPGVTVEGQAT
jgi:hypothetical protein